MKREDAVRWSSRERNRSESSGISVSAKSSESSTATTSVRHRAVKNSPTTPESRVSGEKTTTVVAVEPITGPSNS